MADNNPYSFDSDIDDDIFDSEDKKTGGNGAHTGECPACKAVDSLPGSIPNHVRQELSDLLHKIGGDALVQAVMEGELDSPPTRALEAFLYMDFSGQVASPELVMIRAIMDTLDEMTDGAASKRWNAYRYERHLWNAHNNLRALESALTGVEEFREKAEAQIAEWNEDTSHNKDIDKVQEGLEMSYALENVFRFFAEMMVERIPEVRDDYIAACEEAGIEPHQLLVDEGMYDEENWPELIEMLVSHINNKVRDIFEGAAKP